MRPLEALLAWFLTVATLILFASVQPAPPVIDWTDSGVGCIDDCLSPAEEPEPLPVVQA